MIKRDYILRWTQELAQVLARLMGKKPELQLHIIRETYHELLSLDLATMEALQPDELIPYLTEQLEYNDGQLEFLAEMLYREGKIQLEQAQILSGRRRLQEALLIFEFLDAKQDVFSLERQQQMETIRSILTTDN